MRTTYKNRARRLQKAIQTNLGVPCSLGLAYEIMAQEENYHNWDTLSATIPENTSRSSLPHEALSWDLQYYCAQFVKQGLHHNYRLDAILEMLQKDDDVGDVWRRVNLDHDPDAPGNLLYQAFEQTKSFDPNALRYLKMPPGVWASALDPMIEYMRENRTVHTT